MKNLFAALVLLVLPARFAAGSPTLDFSWQDCSPIVHDRVLPSGETTSDLLVLASNLTDAHIGYQVVVMLGSRIDCGPHEVPDAWRMDASGCQGPAFLTMSNASISKACPAIVAPSVTNFDVSYDPSYGREVITYLRSYQGTPQTPDPTKQYLLFKLRFDHTYAVSGAGEPPLTCGGFEKGVCIASWPRGGGVFEECPTHPAIGARASMDLATGAQVPFLLATPDLVASFRTESGTNSCALATPARSTTWGAVRGMYR